MEKIAESGKKGKKTVYQKGNKDFSLTTLRRNYTHPHEYYTRLRTHNSIYFDANSQCWLITAHGPMAGILDDPRFSSGLGEVSTTPLASLSKQMLFMDGEKHRKAQNVMLRPLADLVKKMPEDIRSLAHAALNINRQSGEIDLVSDFASSVSLLAIAQVLGISTKNREELLQLERWSDTFGDLTSGYFKGDMQDVQRLEDYFRRLIEEKRRQPGEDLISAFIKAGDVFPDESDLIANTMMVFAAGRLTTKKLLGNGVPLLLSHWEQYQQEFRTNPRSFIKSLSEELLRMVTPTRYLMRQATTEVDLSAQFPGDHVIRQGQRVLLFLEAGNYDPGVFSQPTLFDPHRRPNKHIAFGYGSHQCPGATMARLEIQIALEVLFSLSHMYLKPGTEPVWNANPNLGGYISCPVLIRP